MGGSQSHEQSLLEAYYTHMKKNNPHLIVKGGSEKEVLGGYSALEEYGNSVYSKSKEELIRGLAKDVGGLLGLKDAHSGSIEQIIKKFKEVLPKPGSGKGSLRADPSKHAKLCKLLAKAVNKRYDMEIINEDAEPHIICQRVAELMYSLFTGLHTEFLTIAGDVSRIVKNLEILQGIVDSANKKIMNDLASCADENISMEAENSKKLYTKLSDEIKRQHVMLSNIINSSIGPIGSSLITILSDNKDFTGLVEDLKRSTGVEYFGDKLSYLLSGISDVAHSAHLVDKALKKIGLSVSEYKNVRGLNELRNKVYDSISKKRPSSQELHKLLLAADILYRNDLVHDDIAAYLSKKSGGDIISMEPSESSFADMVDDANWSDPTSNPFSGRSQSYRSSVGKQLKDQRKYRNMLFADLNVKIKANYRNIISIIGRISQKVGGEIQPSPKLEKFIRLLVSFSKIQPDKKNLHIALSGYRSDSTSNFIKYQFLDYLDILKEESDNLSRESGGMYFKELANAFHELIRLIDDFNIVFTKSLSELHIVRPTLGGDDNVLDMEEKNMDGGKKSHHKKVHFNNESELENMEEVEHNMEEVEHNMEEVEHNAEDELKMENAMLKSSRPSDSVAGGYNDVMAEVLGGIIRNLSSDHFRHFITLKKAIREMDYYYRISNIKNNLRKMSVENKENSANYENILGEEAGWMIDQINRKQEGIMASLNENGVRPTQYPTEKALWSDNYSLTDNITNGVIHDVLNNGNLYSHFKDAKGLTADQKDSNKGFSAGYKFLLEYIRTSKIEMLEAAQAIDLYLSKFTQNIEQDPDTIKSFVEIIEQLEIVAKWFTDKSGDNLAGVFEAFSKKDVTVNDYVLDDGKLNNANGYDLNENKHNNDLKSDYNLTQHYYEEVKNKNVGKFYKPRLMMREEAIQFIKQLEKSIKSVRALENIINLFNKINVQSSGEIKTFMNAGMIFKALMKYCVASVIGLGFRIVNSEDNKNNNLPASSPVIDFHVNGADINNNDTSALLVKTGISLRFSNEYVKIDNYKLLRLCDPFEFKSDISSQSSITDKIFEMCIKSMVSKIFVVVGSYSLFHRPPKNSLLFKSINSSFSINPLRQIMGGSNANQYGGEEGGRAPIQIITEALELYIRLPPLIEWYRKVFQFNKNGPVNLNNYANQNNPIVSFIPEMDNIWRDLCFAIIIDGQTITNGAYPLEIARKIIMSITEIFKHYKNKKSNITCREIIQECIMEINRRYGFMMRNEIETYLDTRGALNKASDEFYPDDDDNVDFDLLDANNALGRRTAPSDRFRSFNVSNSNRTNSLSLFYQAVRRFRQSVEANLLLNQSALGVDASGNPIDVDISLSGDIDMDEIIRLTKMRLDKAVSPEERYMIVLGQLHGVDKFSNVDQNKLLVLHETVINPLTLLYFTYLILNNYNKFMVAINLENLEPAITAYLTKSIKNHGYPNIAVPGPNSDHNQTAYAVAAIAAANNERGNVDKWLALQLLELNNDKFKSGSAKTEYGLHDNNYAEEVEGIDTIENISKYFIPGWRGGDLNNIEINNYLSNADTNIDEILNHLNYGGGVNPNTEERIAVMKRLLIDRKSLMIRILNEVMNLSCEMNGLVDVYFSGESRLRYPLLNFDRLEEICIATFQQAKQSLSKLRKSLPGSLIEQFEKSKTSDNKDNAVSLFYLQEQLFDRLFKNKYGNGLDDGNDGLKNTWLELTREHKFNWIQDNRAYLITDSKGNNKNNWHNLSRPNLRRQPNDAPLDINKNNPGNLPLSHNDYNDNKNASRVSSLLSEYNYDSYDESISEILFWSNCSAINYDSCFGFRIINDTDNYQQFPAHYIPIFKGKESFANPKSKDVKNFVATLPSTKEYKAGVGNDAELLKKVINPKLASIYRGADLDEKETFLISAGFHNLYDYNIKYSAQTFLESSANGLNGNLNAISFREIGGIDKIAPEEAEFQMGTHKPFGLLCKLNNMLYHYMNLFIDPSNKKIYRPLIEKFVNGYNSKDILQGKNINDNVIRRINYADMNNKLNTYLIDAQDRYENDNPNSFSEFTSAVCDLEPPEHAVLFASLASALQTVCNTTTDRTAGTFSLFTEDNLANVSEYQKELMRAYLPMFEKHLEMLIKRAEFIKNVIDQTSCKVYKWRQHYNMSHNAAPATLGLFTEEGKLVDYNLTKQADWVNHHRLFFQTNEELDPTYTQPLRVPLVESESARKSYLIGMATDIMSSAKSLVQCINNVQKELSDVPLFFETYKDSIIDFNNRNQKLPVMPLSILTHLMNFNLHRVDKTNKKSMLADDFNFTLNNDQNIEYNVHLLPQNEGVGSVAFKFAYGTRGLLSHKQKPLVDYAPGMSALLDYEKLGGVSGGAPKFDKSSVQLLVQNNVLLSRYILDYMYPSQYLEYQDYSRMLDLLKRGQNAINTTARNLACQSSKFISNPSADASFWSNSQNVVMMIENDNVRQSVYRLISCLRQNASNSLFNYDRDKMLLFNILDLNIVPINFHALQREIPFVNLMNYSHTFDHLVKETIGVEFKNQPLTNIHGEIPNNPNSPSGEFNNNKMEHTYTNSDFVAVHHPEDQLVRYLMYPLGFRRLREYVNHVYKIMAGATNLSLNRPKYLSDQLWNKVLLNNLFNNKYGDVKNNLNQSRRVAELEQVNVDMNNKYLQTFTISEIVKEIKVSVGAPANMCILHVFDEFKKVSLSTDNLNSVDTIQSLLLDLQRNIINAALVPALNFGDANENNLLHSMLSYNEFKNLPLTQDIKNQLANAGIAAPLPNDINGLRPHLEGFGTAAENIFCNADGDRAACPIFPRFKNMGAIAGAVGGNAQREIIKGVLKLLATHILQKINNYNKNTEFGELTRFELYSRLRTTLLIGPVNIIGNLYDNKVNTQINGQPIHSSEIDNIQESLLSIQRGIINVGGGFDYGDAKNNNLLHSLIFNLNSPYGNLDVTEELKVLGLNVNTLRNVENKIQGYGNAAFNPFRRENGNVDAVPELDEFRNLGMGPPPAVLTNEERAQINATLKAIAESILETYKWLKNGMVADRERRNISVSNLNNNLLSVDTDLQEPLMNGILVSNNNLFSNELILTNLSYLESNGTYKEVYNRNVDAKDLQRLGYEGYLRYNTRLVRWIEWICNVQRVVRILMRQNLEWVQDPVVNEHDVLAEGTTEFGSDNIGYTLQDFE